MRNNKKYPANKSAFLLENDISFYLLGAYMADGHISNKSRKKYFRITSKDEEWLIQIRNIICPNKNVYQYGGVYSLHINDIDCVNWLISYGCKPKKSLDLKVEKPIPTEYQQDFIRGILDGDGCVQKSPYIKRKNGKEYFYTKITCYICSASKDAIESIKKMIPEGINALVIPVKQKESTINGRLVKPTVDVWRLHFNDSHARKFLAWIYYPGHKISLTRKARLASDITAMK